MTGRGRTYQRGTIYYIAYRWDGREYRESARSSEVADAERLLATRLRERREFHDCSPPIVKFVVIKRLIRSSNTPRPAGRQRRVACLVTHSHLP